MKSNIKIDYFYMQPGHGPWLLGGPNTVEPYIEQAKMWGEKRPILVLPPAATWTEPRPGRRILHLPECNLMAWLSSDPINPGEGDYSHLVLIWWADDFPTKLPALDEKTWNTNAKDCYP